MEASINIDEFCKLHRISRGKFYLMKAEGCAPATFQIGRAVRISETAAREWLAALQGAAS